MLFPSLALAHPSPACFPQEYRDLCHNHAAILYAMQDITAGTTTTTTAADSDSNNLELAKRFLTRFQTDCMPPPTFVKFRYPLHICAWRIESPTRTLLPTTSTTTAKTEALPLGNDPAAFKPHQLPKLLLDERSKRPQPSAIHLLPNDADLTCQAVRDSLLYHIKANPSDFRVVPPTRDTTLEEAACVFTAGSASNHSVIALNQSPPWEKDHVDSRYAETQNGINGIRYRDWLCVYASDEAVEKCKLEGHILDITSAHQAFVPWKRHHHEKSQSQSSRTPQTEWCVSRSSLPLEQRVLHDRPPANPADRNISRFTAFTRSVKARLLQDLKLLPMPLGDDAFVVHRHNISVYTDEIAQQVLVVYAPTLSPSSSSVSSPTFHEDLHQHANNSNTQLEFVCFTLLPLSS